jgi:pimeloyl-ACP methyl ester carboxylesterase
MLRSTRLALLAALAAAALAFPAGAAQDKSSTSGVFKIYDMGQTVGAEKFSLKYLPDGNYKAEGNLSTKIGETTLDGTTMLETQGPRRDIFLYQRDVRVNKVPTGIVMKRERDALKIGIASGIQKQTKTVRVTAGAFLVEPGVTHHLIPLLRRYNAKAGGAQTFPVYLGSDLRETTATLAATDDQPAVLQYGTYQARRYFLNLGDVGIQLWVAPSGALLKAENPMQGFLMELAGYDGPKAQAPVVDLPRRKDLSYSDVAFRSGEVQLAGVLVRPLAAAGRLPGVVFVSDDGPQDRDGTVPFTNVNVGTAELADALAATGLVVLRVDDRGIPPSKGSFVTMTLGDAQADAVAALDFLKSRPEVDAGRVALLGHGVGGNLALRIAGARGDVRAVVAIAPSSDPLDRLALEQTQRRLADEGVTDPDAIRYTPIHYILEQAAKTSKKWIVLGEKGIYLDIFRQYAALRPPADLGKVRQPLLLLQGGKDLQVFPRHGEALAQVCAKNGMRNCEPKSFPHLDHFGKPSKGNIGEYSDPTRKVDAGFIRFIAAWLQAHL